MKRFILALALTATPAWAENVTVFVVQEDGGVIQRPSNLTYEEAVSALGRKAPREGTTGVVLEKGEPPHWTDLSPSDVDKEHGGDGDPVVELFPRVKDERDNKEIILFPEEDSASDKITPRSGTWGRANNQSRFHRLSSRRRPSSKCASFCNGWKYNSRHDRRIIYA